MDEKKIRKLWKAAETEECYIEHMDTVPVLRFHAFDEMKFVNAAFSTRFGGISTGHLSELNLGFGRGDSDETVRQNFSLFCESMGVSSQTLVLSDQVHDTELAVVDEKDTCRSVIKKRLKGVDGLLTAQSDVCLATAYADCVPLLFADPVRKAVAASHSGWKGTVKRIGEKTVKKLQESFGSRPEDIVVVIGPSICQSCYEVSREVIDAFCRSYRKESVEKFAYCTNEAAGKYQLDLWKANQIQLQEAGLLPEHIHLSGICTCCHPKLLFSHRASGGKRGNLNGFISIVNEFE